MKKELTTRIYSKVFGVKEDHVNVNEIVKAVIINFGDERGDIIVKNDNFGTQRKYADFTQGKKAAGLNPLQIVFSGIDVAIISNDRFVNENDDVCYFKDYFKIIETMSVTEAAAELELSRNRIYQLIHEKKIELYNGRPMKESIEAYKKNRKPAGRPEGTIKID